MNPQLIRDAVDNLRKVAVKGTYRRLLTSDLVDLEVYLQQILLEIEMPEPGLWEMIKKSLRELK
jgi:hypothetical protein